MSIHPLTTTAFVNWGNVTGTGRKSVKVQLSDLVLDGTSHATNQNVFSDWNGGIASPFICLVNGDDLQCVFRGPGGNAWTVLTNTGFFAVAGTITLLIEFDCTPYPSNPTVSIKVNGVAQTYDVQGGSVAINNLQDGLEVRLGRDQEARQPLVAEYGGLLYMVGSSSPPDTTIINATFATIADLDGGTNSDATAGGTLGVDRGFGEVALDPPNATYAPFTIGCEQAGGPFSPTNAGGAIATATRTGGDNFPAGLSLLSNGNVAVDETLMVAAGIGTYDVIVSLTNSGGTQTGVHITFSVTANPPVVSYAGSPFDKVCAAGSSTANVTHSGAAVKTGGYTLPAALGGLSINADTGQLTHNPTLAHGCAPSPVVVQAESAGGQIGTTTISVEYHYEVTGLTAVNTGGSDPFTIIMRVGVAGGGARSSIQTSSYATSSIARSSWE